MPPLSRARRTTATTASRCLTVDGPASAERVQGDALQLVSAARKGSFGAADRGRCRATSAERSPGRPTRTVLLANGRQPASVQLVEGVPRPGPRTRSARGLIYDPHAASRHPEPVLRRLLPDRDVRGALAGEGVSLPTAPPLHERQTGELRHEVELGGPDVPVIRPKRSALRRRGPSSGERSVAAAPRGTRRRRRGRR